MTGLSLRHSSGWYAVRSTDQSPGPGWVGKVGDIIDGEVVDPLEEQRERARALTDAEQGIIRYIPDPAIIPPAS